MFSEHALRKFFDLAPMDPDAPDYADDALGEHNADLPGERWCEECGCRTNHRGPHPDEGGEG